ncbi:MAG: helix-turn-helix transcriptional regulator [Flavobacteriales bacterium]|nr:MAG: helix-turn-helix transcriptional regulator [Flavobacteriales bacterium]
MLEYLEKEDISKYSFYKETKLSNGFLDKGENMGSDKIERIAEAYPNLNVNWLITGKGEPYLHPYVENNLLKVINEQELQTYNTKTDYPVETQRIPLFEFRASAGLTQLFDKHPNVLNYIEIPNLPPCDGAIFATGDSMYPLVKSGDIVIYKRVNDLRDGIIFGEMYILSIVIDDHLHTLIKFVKKSDLGDDYIQLVSQNSHHASRDVHFRNVGAMALIKASIRYNTMS